MYMQGFEDSGAVVQRLRGFRSDLKHTVTAPETQLQRQSRDKGTAKNVTKQTKTW